MGVPVADAVSCWRHPRGIRRRASTRVTMNDAIWEGVYLVDLSDAINTTSRPTDVINILLSSQNLFQYFNNLINLFNGVVVNQRYPDDTIHWIIVRRYLGDKCIGVKVAITYTDLYTGIKAREKGFI